MDDCIFCRIARGEAEAKVVYADDHFIAFDDIMPPGPVHTLVIPREHFESMNDAPAAVLGCLFATVVEVARLKGVADTGYRVIVNNGPDAAQTVSHLHVHVIGGAPMAHGMVRFRDAGDREG